MVQRCLPRRSGADGGRERDRVDRRRREELPRGRGVHGSVETSEKVAHVCRLMCQCSHGLNFSEEVGGAK